MNYKKDSTWKEGSSVKCWQKFTTIKKTGAQNKTELLMKSNVKPHAKPYGFEQDDTFWLTPQASAYFQLNYLRIGSQKLSVSNNIND